MELKISIDLEASLAQALAPEKLQPILDKHITDALTSAIKDATGYRSKFSEALKEQLGATLPHGLNLGDVAKFQQVLNQAMQSAVHGANAAAVSVALAKAVEDVMPDVPPTMKLSELIEAARADFCIEKHEAFFACYEVSEYGHAHLYLDSDPNPGSSHFANSQKSSAAHRLSFTKEGVVYALRLEGTQLTPAARPVVISRFDSILMSMYVGRTTLEVDMRECDVESAASEQYDD